MPRAMECQVLVYSAFCRNLFQQDICPTISINIEQAISSAERFVTAYDFTGAFHQFHTERDIRLLPYR